MTGLTAPRLADVPEARKEVPAGRLAGTSVGWPATSREEDRDGVQVCGRS